MSATSGEIINVQDVLISLHPKTDIHKFTHNASSIQRTIDHLVCHASSATISRFQRQKAFKDLLVLARTFIYVGWMTMKTPELLRSFQYLFTTSMDSIAIPLCNLYETADEKYILLYMWMLRLHYALKMGQFDTLMDDIAPTLELMIKFRKQVRPTEYRYLCVWFFALLCRVRTSRLSQIRQHFHQAYNATVMDTEMQLEYMQVDYMFLALTQEETCLDQLAQDLEWLMSFMDNADYCYMACLVCAEYGRALHQCKSSLLRRHKDDFRKYANQLATYAQTHKFIICHCIALQLVVNEYVVLQDVQRLSTFDHEILESTLQLLRKTATRCADMMANFYSFLMEYTIGNRTVEELQILYASFTNPKPDHLILACEQLHVDFHMTSILENKQMWLHDTILNDQALRKMFTTHMFAPLHGFTSLKTSSACGIFWNIKGL